jgi:hypothetical protein
MSSLALSDLSTSTAFHNSATFPHSILQATQNEDRAEVSETISITYQILLLTYQTASSPSLADVLNSHKIYFQTNEDHSDENERTYQYILDLSLSSEQDWWSKLEVESKKLRKKKKKNLFGNNDDSDSDSDFNGIDANNGGVSPLLSWAAICWLETSFSSRSVSLPEQIVTLESKHDLANFQTQYPGLNSQMQIQGREKDQPHWWTGRSSSGLSLYLSSAVALQKFKLSKIFKKWEHHAAMKQFARYKNKKLQLIFHKRDLHNFFNEWKSTVNNESILEYFSLHRHFRYWKRWLTKVELRIPFIGWATEIRRWKRKLIAFDYWSNLSFTRQKKHFFKRWVKNERIEILGHFFSYWSNMADKGWENRRRVHLAFVSVHRIRIFRIKIWVLNVWNEYIFKVYRYRDGIHKLSHIAQRWDKKQKYKALEAWYHAHMLDSHLELGNITISQMIARNLHHTQETNILTNSQIRSSHDRMIKANEKIILCQCWKKWVHMIVLHHNQQLLHNTAVRHLRERLIGHSFYKWNLVLVDKRCKLRKELLATKFRYQHLAKKYFYKLVVHLIKARQIKIKLLEATIHYNQNIQEKYYLKWWRMSRIDVKEAAEDEKNRNDEKGGDLQRKY